MMRYDLLIVSLIVLSVVSFAVDIITKKQRREKIAVFFILSAVVIFSSAGLLKFDNISGQDGYFHIMRILGIAENINRGIPFSKVNYVFNQGYGYFDPVFYPRLFLWIPGIMVAVGMNISNAYRIFLLLINIATVFVSFKCFDRMTQNKLCAVAATALYTLNYYRMSDMYIRASVGELLFIAFFPMVLCGIYSIFRRRENSWLLLAAGATFVLQSHIIGTLLTAISGVVLISGYLVYDLIIKKGIKNEIVCLVKAGIATVAANLWFLIPLVYYIRQDFVMFAVNPEYFARYQQPFFNMFFKRTGFDDVSILSHMGPMTGLVFAAVIMAAVVLAVKNKKVAEGTAILAVSAAVLFTASVYMPWVKLSSNPAVYFIVDSMQFSFRAISVFLALLVMASVLIAGKFKGNGSKGVFVALALVLCLSSFDYYSMMYNERSVVRGYNGEYEINTFCPSEYLLNAANKDEVNNPDKLRTLTDEITVKTHEYYKAGSRVVVDNNSAEDNYIEIPLFYYDGYTAYSVENDIYLPVQPGGYGVVRVVVPPSVTGEIIVQFSTRNIFHAAEIISLLSAAAICFCAIKRKRKNIV